jgi:hypothetical protein
MFLFRKNGEFPAHNNYSVSSNNMRRSASHSTMTDPPFPIAGGSPRPSARQSTPGGSGHDN